jgi:hypothetical protein
MRTDGSYSFPVLMKIVLFRQILEKNPQKSNFMKIRPVRTESFHADIDIDIFVNCNWADTRWQYTFTHKQYLEHHN